MNGMFGKIEAFFDSLMEWLEGFVFQGKLPGGYPSSDAFMAPAMKIVPKSPRWLWVWVAGIVAVLLYALIFVFRATCFFLGGCVWMFVMATSVFWGPFALGTRFLPEKDAEGK